MVAAMTAEPLTHNPLSAVTAGVWKQRSVVHKVLPRHREAPAHLGVVTGSAGRPHAGIG
jgi:hypothetical protein